LNKQLNIMQTTHLQQPDHIFSLNERHTTHNTSVLRESHAECVVYVTVFFW